MEGVMMHKIFLDTNVLIDVLQVREKFYDDSFQLVYALDDTTKYLSALTIANASYIVKKLPRREFAEFIRLFEIVDLSQDVIEKAMISPVADFEDAIQAVSCMQVCDTLITRNQKHFDDYKDVLNILTPAEYLTQLA